MSNEEIESIKRRIRAEMKSRRAAVPPELRTEKSHELCQRLVGLLEDEKIVCCYDALKTELDLSEFIAECRRRGIVVVFPEPMETPSGKAYVVPQKENVDLWICPGLAFTREGDRLGFGGGWYDRFLARRKLGARAFGVAYEFQIVDDLPRGDWDMLLEGVVVV